MPTAMITGASAGLGRALTAALYAQGWQVVITARGRERLDSFAAHLREVTPSSGVESSLRPTVTAIAGDVADPAQRARLVAAIGTGTLDLLVNNASTLGPGTPGHPPLSRLEALSPAAFADVLSVNVIAPFALTAALLPALSRGGGGVVIDISSDAAIEHYPDWGGYGASKAALDHLTLTFGVENLDIACYAVDPGDMRTEMQQAAFPGEDISDRRSPDDVVPALLQLLTARPPSGRYRVDDLLTRAEMAADHVTEVFA